MLNNLVFRIILVSLLFITIKNQESRSFLDRQFKILEEFLDWKHEIDRDIIDEFDPASLTALALTGLNNRNKPIIIKVITRYGDHPEEFDF